VFLVVKTLLFHDELAVMLIESSTLILAIEIWPWPKFKAKSLIRVIIIEFVKDQCF